MQYPWLTIGAGEWRRGTQYFQREGWELAYRDTGLGHPVLLAHGLLLDHSMFDPQITALADRYRVITPDLRNHGASQHRAEPFTQWDLMEDHIALLDHLGVDRAVWGGVSQGGFQSLRAALRHPQRVAGLILIDTSARAEDDSRAPLYEASAEAIAAWGWTPDLAQVAALAIFGTTPDQSLTRIWVDHWLTEDTTGARERMWAVTRRDDLTSRVREVSAPALVIHGEQDIAIDMAEAEELVATLPNLVEFVRVPGAGHSSTMERPEPVTAAIARFLASLGL